MEGSAKAPPWASAGKSPFVRLLAIGFLVLLLHIPTSMIQGVIRERQATRAGAISEVTEKWGRHQTVLGPLITVPYVKKTYERDKDGAQKVHTEIRYANFLPERLQISGKIETEVRYRGIFEVPVYRMPLTLTGQFARPDLSEWKINAEDILWDRAYLSVRISDVRAITNQAFVTWNDGAVSFLPGSGDASPKSPGIHAELKSLLQTEPLRFSFTLNLNGSEKALFAPFGKKTTLALTSNWADPSFQGAWLPSKREVGDKGFHAIWTIPFLGRNYPQSWISGKGFERSIYASLFGVSLISPVDQYRMADRSVKYVTLFLALTFVVLWLFEVLASIRVHLVQYLLVGAGMCLFYLLELSLAEHLGFNLAYTIASCAIVALVSSYCVAVLKSGPRAVVVGAAIVLLYGYLYILLREQDYALLVGSVGLFAVLATIMYLTRRVDWYAPRT
jgi:inner membrane protein